MVPCWFGGYRYGFDPDNGGHEAFVGWGRDALGALDLPVQELQPREPHLWCCSKGPKIDQLMVEATYVSQGPKRGTICFNPKLIERPRGIAGLSLVHRSAS